MAMDLYALKGRFQERAAALKKKAERKMGMALSAAATVAGATGASFLSGRLGGAQGKKLGPAPVEAIIGLPLVVAGVLEVAGPYSEQLAAAGAGAVAAPLARKSFEKGAQGHAEANRVGGVSGAGCLGPGQTAGAIGAGDSEAIAASAAYLAQIHNLRG